MTTVEIKSDDESDTMDSNDVIHDLHESPLRMRNRLSQSVDTGLEAVRERSSSLSKRKKIRDDCIFGNLQHHYSADNNYLQNLNEDDFETSSPNSPKRKTQKMANLKVSDFPYLIHF
jgi:hypothetical protein